MFANCGSHECARDGNPKKEKERERERNNRRKEPLHVVSEVERMRTKATLGERGRAINHERMQLLLEYHSIMTELVLLPVTVSSISSQLSQFYVQCTMYNVHDARIVTMPINEGKKDEGVL